MHSTLNPILWKILMVDDDEDDYCLVRNMLSEARHGKCTLEWADSYEAGKAALRRISYDAVLMDYDLGLHNGLELIREATAQQIRSLACSAGAVEVSYWQWVVRASRSLIASWERSSSVRMGSPIWRRLF